VHAQRGDIQKKMSETNYNQSYQGTLKVKRNHRPGFGEVLFAWSWYFLFRWWTYRFFFAWGLWGALINYFLLFSAIGLTIRALFTPRYRYEFYKESDSDESSQVPLKEESVPTEPITPLKQDTIHAESTEEASTPPPEPAKVTPPPKVELKPELSKPGEKRKAVQEALTKKEIKKGIKFCSYCGVENPDYARYCATCGEKLG
jgi:hypothetical protein